VSTLIADPAKSLLLLDKIKDVKGVLDTMIRLLLQRQKPEYFCSTELRGMPEAYKVEKRVTEEYSLLLNAYKK
jgi:hypothetical protein